MGEESHAGPGSQMGSGTTPLAAGMRAGPAAQLALKKLPGALCSCELRGVGVPEAAAMPVNSGASPQWCWRAHERWGAAGRAVCARTLLHRGRAWAAPLHVAHVDTGQQGSGLLLQAWPLGGGLSFETVPPELQQGLHSVMAAKQHSEQKAQGVGAAHRPGRRLAGPFLGSVVSRPGV